MRYDVTNLNDWAIGESLYKWIRENLEENIKGFKRPCSMTEIILTLITGKL